MYKKNFRMRPKYYSKSDIQPVCDLIVSINFRSLRSKLEIYIVFHHIRPVRVVRKGLNGGEGGGGVDLLGKYRQKQSCFYKIQYISSILIFFGDI